jgi:hypothetical protein
MSDDVDDLLRRAMATLDHQIPEGTFDTLAERTLLRLDDPAFAQPFGALGEDEEHEGLRASASLAEEEGYLQGAQGTVDELARARALRDSRAHGNQASDSALAAPAVAQAATRTGGQARSNRRSSVLAVIGLGVAAAAGVTLFVSSRDKDSTAPEMAARAREQAQVVARNDSPTGTLASSPSKPRPIEAANQAAASGSAAVAPEPAVAARDADSVASIAGGAGGAGGDQIAQIAIDTSPGDAKLVVPPAKGGGPKTGASIELKKAMGNRGKGKFYDASSKDPPSSMGKVALSETAQRDGNGASPDIATQGSGKPRSGDTPALARRSLSNDDFQRGMTAVTTGVKACLAGKASRVRVALTVTPSGQVQKVMVVGPLASTPVGVCIERAVKVAAFPPWDGDPASLGYDYVLSD